MTNNPDLILGYYGRREFGEIHEPIPQHSEATGAESES
jgi:hypothetical protein